VAVVDSSAYRSRRRVHDVVADARPLLVAKGLFERIQLLLTLTYGGSQNPGKPDPQLILQFWIATDLPPDQGIILLQRRHDLLLRACGGIQIVGICLPCHRNGKTGESCRHAQT
jgi:hypothetical protein